jgi:hypothetical protein
LGIKSRAEELGKCAVWPKMSELKVVDKEGVVVREISTTKKTASTFCWNNRKVALRTSQELARHYYGIQGIKL